MFETLDNQTRLSRRQFRLALIAAWAICLEFLDLFLIGFILTFVAVPWHLNTGQSSIILISSGIGAIVGAIYFGRLADRIGRRKVFVITIGIFTLSTAALVFTPESADFGWLYLVLFRVLVGFGGGGLYVVDLPLVQEFMPTSKRGRVSGIVTASVPLGFLLGSVLVWLLSASIGWRGIVLVAAGLSFTVLLMRLSIPESPRYLARQGDLEGARRSIAWALEVEPHTLPLEAAEVAEPTKRPGIAELLSYPRSFWTSVLANLGMQTGYYGLTLWTPTLLVLVMGISAGQTGLFMSVITLGALAGRFVLSFLSESIGRRRAGGLAGIAAAVLLIIASLTSSTTFLGLSTFFLVMVLVYFFGEGGFAIVGPYSAEVWPNRLRTTGMGMAYGIGGIGKVIGPLGLGLLLGSSNLVKPEASPTNLVPAFTYFAAWYLLCAAMFIFVGFETKNKSLAQLESELEGQQKRVKVHSR
jgi:putative MFS transporter